MSTKDDAQFRAEVARVLAGAIEKGWNLQDRGSDGPADQPAGPLQIPQRGGDTAIGSIEPRRPRVGCQVSLQGRGVRRIGPAGIAAVKGTLCRSAGTLCRHPGAREGELRGRGCPT